MGVRDLFELGGKTALITGGSRGLGQQMAEALGEMGCRVAITARKADELAQAKAHLERLGIEVLTVVNDLSKPEGIPGLVNQVLERFGTIDILINIASIAGLRGTPPGMNTISYSTSKAAAINFTRTLASEWGQYDINVNAILPGFFPSKMASGLIGQFGDTLLERTPLRRIGGEEDLKGAVIYLASQASRHVTGHALVVDGGSSIV